MEAYRTPEGRDPGRLLHEYRPHDRRPAAAIVLTTGALVGLFSLVWRPRTPGHLVLLVALGFLSLAVIVQLLQPSAPRIRIFEEGLALTGRRDTFVPWAGVKEVLVAHGAEDPRPHTVAIVSLRLANGSKVKVTLEFANNQAVIAEIQKRTAEHLVVDESPAES